MSAPASEDLRELERLLTVAAESGESVTRSGVQDELQVSGQEAEQMLEALREHGKAVEVAPGEWRGPTQDELDRTAASGAPEPVVVSVPAERENGEVSDGADPEPVARGAVEWPAFTSTVRPDANVRFSRAVADALDADALGKIVKAAIDATGEDEDFVFEVTP